MCSVLGSILTKESLEVSAFSALIRETYFTLAGSDSSSSDCSSSDDSEVVAEKEEEEEGVSAIDWIPLKTLGEWEQYTTVSE